MTVPPGVVRIGVVVGVPEPHGPGLRAARRAPGGPAAPGPGRPGAAAHAADPHHAGRHGHRRPRRASSPDRS